MSTTASVDVTSTSSAFTDEGRVSTPALVGGPSYELVSPEFLGTRPRRKLFSTLVRVSVPVALVATWVALTASGRISPQVLAAPGEVWTAFLEIIETGQLVEYLGASLVRATVGLTLGALIGITLGCVAGLSSVGEELVDPTMQVFRSVSFLALVPLFVAWFGIDETFKYVVIAFAASIPIYAYVYLGVRGVDRKVIEAGRGFGLRGWRLARQVVLPTALPNIFMALRIGLAVTITGLIVAEQIGTDKGIGYLVILSKQYFRTDYTVLCIILYALLGLGFDLVLRTAERTVMPWQRVTTIR